MSEQIDDQLPPHIKELIDWKQAMNPITTFANKHFSNNSHSNDSLETIIK